MYGKKRPKQLIWSVIFSLFICISCTEGSNLKPPLSKGKSGRRISFAARFGGMKGPMKDDKGRPTRKALALKKWGFRSAESARNFANRNKA